MSWIVTPQHYQMISHGAIQKYYPVPNVKTIEDLRITIDDVIESICKEWWPLCNELRTFQRQVEKIHHTIWEMQWEHDDDRHRAIIQSINGLDKKPGSALWIDNLHNQVVEWLETYRQLLLWDVPELIISPYAETMKRYNTH